MSLRDHILKEDRITFGSIQIYNPTKSQKQKILDLIKENSTIENVDGQLVNNTKINEITQIRFLLKELTSFGEEIDEYTDEELIDILDNPVSIDLEKTMRELHSIIKELTEGVAFETNAQIDAIHEFFTKQLPVYQKLDDIAKVLGVSVDDLMLIKQAQEKGEMPQIAVKDAKKPQDHLPKQSSKKRGRPKKVDKVIKDTEEVKESDINA